MATTISPFQNTASNYVYTTPGGLSGAGTITTASWQNPSPAVIMEKSGVVQLTGDEADLVINGISLTETLKAIQAQLGILRPNVELEAEWDELQELGRLYRQKEEEFKEKKRMWDIMKKSEG
jgi:hypothetical protein